MTMFGLRTVGLVLAFAVAMAAGPGEAKTAPGYDFSAVTAYMDRGYRSLGYPGASMLVVQNDKVLYEQYFGTFTPKTVVPIASASKWLSAAVIMTLVDDGKIDLDARIDRYIPDFKGVMATMTIRQMLSHTSGLVGFKGERAEWNYGMSMQDYARRVAEHGVMEGPPGSGVRYASVSMQVVGAVAEKVSGKTWAQLVKEKITEPCDMPDTRYVRTPGTTDPKTLGDPTGNPMLAAGAQSSLRDYGHFLDMLAHNGVYMGRRVLSEASVREMQRDQTGAQPLLRGTVDRKGRKSHYGLGEWVDVQAPDGRTIQVSSPGAWGFRPWLDLDRDLYGIIMVKREVGGQLLNDTYDPWTLIDLVHAAADAGH